MQKLVGERAAAAQQEWLGTLDDEEEGITRQNVALAANVKLLQERRLTTLALAEVERERQKIEIDANPNMSDADKIRAQFPIDEAGEKERAAEKIKVLEDATQSGRDAAEQADELARRKAIDLDAVAKSKADLETLKKEIEQKIRAEENKTKALPGLKDRKSDYESDVFWNRAFDASADVNDFDIKIDALEKSIADAEAAPIRKVGLKTKLAKVDAPLKATIDQEETLKNELAQAEIDAERARADAKTSEAIAREQAARIRDTYKGKSDNRRSIRDQRAGEADAKDAKEKAAEDKRITEKKQRAKDKEDRDLKSEERSESARIREAAGIGKSAASLIPKGAKESLRKAIENAAAKLQNGDQGSEIEDLAKMIESLAVSASSAKKVNKVNLAALQERIRKLEGK